MGASIRQGAFIRGGRLLDKRSLFGNGRLLGHLQYVITNQFT